MENLLDSNKVWSKALLLTVLLFLMKITEKTLWNEFIFADLNRSCRLHFPNISTHWLQYTDTFHYKMRVRPNIHPKVLCISLSFLPSLWCRCPFLSLIVCCACDFSIFGLVYCTTIRFSFLFQRMQESRYVSA